MTYLFSDLFAGIGGMRLAFEENGGQCVLTSENDEYALNTYIENFGEIDKKSLNSNAPHIFHKDILTLTKQLKEIPYHHVLVGGFPCQPYSIAGLRKGLKDTRGGEVFTAILDILKKRKPPIFLLENVKNMKSHDNGNTFNYMINELEKCGYYTKFKILNTMEYANIPQNRERVFIVGFRNENQINNFEFPKQKILNTKIHDFFEDQIVDYKYYYNWNLKPTPLLVKEITNPNTIYQYRRVYVRANQNNVCPTLTFNMGSGGHNVPLILIDKKFSVKDLSNGRNLFIRKLTPEETAAFQGFPNDLYFKALKYSEEKIKKLKKFKFPASMADTRKYNQIGNSVTVPLIKQLAKQILKVM